MIIKIDKQTIIEEFSIIEKVTDLYYEYFNYFKFLKKDEFDRMCEILETWYYNMIPISKKKYNEDVTQRLFKKMRDNINLPAKLYRGMHFQKEEKLDEFVKHFKEHGTIREKHNNKNIEMVSWSSSLKQAKKFVGQYGLILEQSKKDYKEFFLFSLLGLIPNVETQKEFLKKIYEVYHSKHLKMFDKISTKNDIKKMNIHGLFVGQWGASLSTKEEEYLLKFQNAEELKNCKITIFKTKRKKNGSKNK